MCWSVTVSALEIETGVGAGMEYTDNVHLASVDESEDAVTIGYVGATISETGGSVNADANASLRKQHYSKDSYPDKSYFDLGATVDWEMLKQRFSWLLQDYYSQVPVDTLDPNTPDNIQDSNIFTFGANVNFPVSTLQSIVLRPEYRNFYYETLSTDNQQYSLTVNWNYRLTRLTSIGLSASQRVIDYDEPGIAEVTYNSAYLVVSSKRVRSDISADLGMTRVDREDGQSTEAFSGNLSWELNLVRDSSLNLYLSTDLTDSGDTSLRAVVDPSTGNPVIIQVAADVIRNKVMTVGYHRRDGTLASSLTGELHELDYSVSPNDRKIRSLNASLDYPLTALLSSRFFAQYRSSDLIADNRTDNEYSASINLGYRLSRKLRSSIDIRYARAESTLNTRSYREFSAFVSLVYGYGYISRPGRGRS